MFHYAAKHNHLHFEDVHTPLFEKQITVFCNFKYLTFPTPAELELKSKQGWVPPHSQYESQSFPLQ